MEDGRRAPREPDASARCTRRNPSEPRFSARRSRRLHPPLSTHIPSLRTSLTPIPHPQDGPTAGQSVPHVHIHLIPRKETDFPAGENDRIYPALEDSERRLGSVMAQQQQGETGTGAGRGGLLRVPKDSERVPRTEEEMEREAAWLAEFFIKGETV